MHSAAELMKVSVVRYWYRFLSHPHAFIISRVLTHFSMDQSSADIPRLRAVASVDIEGAYPPSLQQNSD